MNHTLSERYYRRVPASQQAALLQFRIGHPQKQILVQDAAWTYLSGGQGQEAIAFLPGGLGQAEAWFQLIAAFERDYRTIAVTYPSVSSMKELADGIACILEMEGIQQAHIVGASMGGMLAQCFLRLYPEKVGRLILANSMAPNKEYAERVDRSNQRALKFPMWLIRFASVRSLAKHLEAVQPSEREFWKAYFKEAIYSGWSHESIARQNQCIVDYMLNYEFKPGEFDWMSERILILASDDDKAIPPELSAALKDLYPGSRLHIFHNAGHVPLITRREEYVALIQEHLMEGQPMTPTDLQSQRS